MKAHIARTLYESHVLFVAKKIGDTMPDWEVADPTHVNYFMKQAEAVLLCLIEPTKEMVDAAVDEMKQPRLVTDNKLEDQLAKQFRRYYEAAIGGLLAHEFSLHHIATTEDSGSDD